MCLKFIFKKPKKLSYFVSVEIGLKNFCFRTEKKNFFLEQIILVHSLIISNTILDYYYFKVKKLKIQLIHNGYRRRAVFSTPGLSDVARQQHKTTGRGELLACRRKSCRPKCNPFFFVANRNL